MAALKRAGEGLSRITMKMRKASTPLELAEMRADEICEILKWARPNSKKWLPGMERTPAQHFLAIGDVWCDACNKIDAYEYWSNKRRDGKWPQLVPVALYWISFETSSIIAERAFAILRTIEAPMRHRQLVANWVRELRFRVMKKTVAAMLEEALAKVQ